VVVGEDEDLRLAGETTKSTRVQDAVAVSLEARTKLVGFFFLDAMAAALTPRGSRRHEHVEEFLTLAKGAGERGLTFNEWANGGVRVPVCDGHVVLDAFVTTHRRGPAPGAIGDGFVAHVSHLASAP
jgi:hypothetical protein